MLLHERIELSAPFRYMQSLQFEIPITEAEGFDVLFAVQQFAAQSKPGGRCLLANVWIVLCGYYFIDLRIYVFYSTIYFLKICKKKKMCYQL